MDHLVDKSYNISDCITSCNSTANTSCQYDTTTLLPTERADQPFHLLLLAFLVNIVIISVGIIGNASVIWVICRCRKLRESAMNIYILNMAIADLMLNLFGIPDAVQFMLNKGWLMGDAACKVCRFTLVISLYLSILSLLAVTIERTVAIMQPMKARSSLTKNRVFLAIGGLWVVSAGCALPTGILVKVVGAPGSDLLHCRLDIAISHYYIYKYLEFALIYAAPLITQVILYLLISKTLRRTNILKHSIHSAPSDKNSKTEFDETPGEDELLKSKFRKKGAGDLEDCVDERHYNRSSNGSSAKQLARERRGNSRRSSNAARTRYQVIRMLTACVIVYFISYTPAQIFFFYDAFSKKGFGDTWILRVILYALTSINASANPIIYYCFSGSYRMRLRAMYRCNRRASEARRLQHMDSTIRSAGSVRAFTTMSRIDTDYTHTLPTDDAEGEGPTDDTQGEQSSQHSVTIGQQMER